MNDDLISRSALGEHKFVSIDCYLKSNVDSGYSQYKQGWNDAIDAIIDNAPTVEVYTEEQVKELVELNRKLSVERPQGEWIIDGHHYKCSICGKTLAIIPNESDDDLIGCPYCLADMRDKEADND